MKRKVIDVADRTVATFVQAFVAIILASNVTDLTAVKAAGIAGGLAVLKYLAVVANNYLAAHPE